MCVYVHSGMDLDANIIDVHVGVDIDTHKHTNTHTQESMPDPTLAAMAKMLRAALIGVA